MKPIDYRNETWSDLQGRITGQRQQVFNAWRMHGPCTTEELAEKTGMSILNVRPRTTELFQLGLVGLASDTPASAGIYRALSYSEARTLFERNAKEASVAQLQLL